MITVTQAVNKYCTERGLPEPSHHDYRNCGALISTHFRRHWGLKNPHVVDEVRYVIEETKFKKLVVISYPISFQEEMVSFIDLFFTDKARRVEAAEKEALEKVAKKELQGKKMRTRKPVQQPVYSTKKSP